MRKVRRLATIAAVALGLGYASIVLAAFVGQRSILYVPPESHLTPVLRGATLLRLDGPGGAPVFALYLAAPLGAPTVVHFHGNAEQLADTVPLAADYRAAGLGFFSIEYPGYGLAHAETPTEEALYSAAAAGLAHLSGALGVPREAIVLEGHSLGCGVAVEMALRGLGARLILVSPFTSISDMGMRVLPILPGNFLVLDRFDNAAKAPLLRLPTLVLHGASDETVPTEMGARLGRLIPGARFLAISGAGHGDVFDRPGVLPELARFAAAATP